MALPLSPPVFSILSQLIEETTGLHYEARDADLLAERLSVRASELELDSLLDYYYYLRYDEAGPRELEALVDLLVVNETYFFREVDQLRALVELLLPQRLAKQPSCRVWCAACSTGEEPLTLAMLLEERGLLDRVEILASDVSSRVLAKAERGTYSGRALRALGDAARQRHFVTREEGALGVRPALYSRIRWQRVNLLDFDRVGSLGSFDVILCRNVLIYFRDETVVRLVDRFAKSLTVGGLLLVGASESLLRFGTAFDCQEHGGAFFYKKSGGA
jgi:chemotaxis protein methyltransferase CheR